MTADKTIYTIGHSTRTIDEFVEVLQQYKIKHLVDVRTMPRSRHTPQFNSDELEKSLAKHSIKYTHMSKLGGLRHTTKDSINKAWRNTSFRGYADYMGTPEFESGIDDLTKVAQKHKTAIMCAEAVPWRCHRSMVGDALIVRGWNVIDIFDVKKSVPEKLTNFAHVKNTQITYPLADEQSTDSKL